MQTRVTRQDEEPKKVRSEPMNPNELPMDAGRPRSPLDAARIGAGLVDRFGVTWWLLARHAPYGFASGLSLDAARQAAEEVGTVTYSQLKQIGWPLRAKTN